MMLFIDSHLTIKVTGLLYMQRSLYALLIISISLFLPPVTGFAQELSLSDLYKNVYPSVVVIRTKEHGASRRQIGKTATSSGLGTGVVISADGLVMTAAHIIQQADIIVVHFYNGYEASAKVVAASAVADVALIQLDAVPKDLVFAELGNSDAIDIGQDVFVIGAPYGLSYTLTVGHISGRRRPQNQNAIGTQIEFLQTDAAINQGNSGGPMFTMDGKVVGIVSHIKSQSGGYEGLGFVATINMAKSLLLEHNAFWSGVESIPIDGELAKALNLPQEMGLLVQRVAHRSPGYYLELQGGTIPINIGDDSFFIGGDVILEVDGIRIDRRGSLRARIDEHFANMSEGTRYEVKVLRAGKIVTLSTTR